MSINKIPKLIKFLFLVFVTNVLLFGLWRLAFWLYFRNPIDPIPISELAFAFYVGFKFDIRLALLLILPVYILAWYRPINLFRDAIKQRLWITYFALTLVLSLLLYVVNFGHFAYLHIPLDATALRFLEDFDTSMLMVWQTYPVIQISLGLVVMTSLYVWALTRALALIGNQAKPDVPRKQHVSIVVITTLLMIFAIYGKISWYPLRWSDAFASTHPLASSVSVNPILYSLNTLKNREIDFDLAATKQVYPDIAAYLHVENPDVEMLNYRRASRANKLAVQQPNVVMVLLESFASYKTGLGKNPLNPTPHVDSLAKNGIYFDNFFTPSTGTARSVFAAMTGLPDIELVKTSSRNPLAVNQNIIMNAFSGYEKLYFLGGSASWGNIRGLLKRNIDGLRVYEEGSYDSPSIDVWGISDLDLFKEANMVLTELGDKPFFAVIQTSGNHRPYTIPENNHGFQNDQRDENEVKRYGFQSSKEFNSFRFMDHSVGYFIEQARQSDYFDNTIFMFFGDHGIYANTGEHTVKSEQQLGLHGYRVPLIIYAPKLLAKGKVYHKVASEVDVLPTLAGLASRQYINTTIGRDLFDERFDQQRYAFIGVHAHNSVQLTLIGSEFYFKMDVDGANMALHRLKSDNARANVNTEYPQISQEMAHITRAIFESTRYMRYNNGAVKNHLAQVGDSGTDSHVDNTVDREGTGDIISKQGKL